MSENNGTVELAPADEAVLKRLKRIEGQVRGLQRMLTEGRECHEIVTQLLAARSALDQVGLTLLNTQLDRCLPPDGTSLNGGVEFSDLRRVLDLWIRLGN
jgi:DNA-binding FrmR family transcriptional regulator